MTPPAEVHDAAPAEAAKWRFVRRRGFAVCQSHGFREVSPSAIAGEALRDDPMVAIARTYVEQAHIADRFARWMTIGEMFDKEPIGALRWRSWQALSGVTFGAAEPAADAELAALFLNLASDLGLESAEVVASTVGDAGDVQRFIDATAEMATLRCANCRGSSGPLRFLTCEDEGCVALAQTAPSLRDFIGLAALKHHESLLATLDASGFTVRDVPRLGFGPGRYNRTVLELRATPEGASAPITIARGGRRDALVAAAGGASAPSVGFTLGVARTAACVPGDGESYEHACELFIAARGTAARAWALRAAAAERSRGFRVDVDLREVGWADQLQRAERVRARVVVVVGEVERKKGEVAIRDMITRETRHIPEERLPAELKRLLR
jgi:histidyl-tRNA synthetase